MKDRDEPARWPWAVAGAVLGLAFANHVLSALLVPIGGLWLLWRMRPIRRRWRPPLGIALYLGCFSGLVTFLCWPWLWADPIVRAARAARRVIDFPLSMDVLHLGRLYPAAELPREYFLVHLLAATPLFVLAAAGLGVVPCSSVVGSGAVATSASSVAVAAGGASDSASGAASVSASDPGSDADSTSASAEGDTEAAA